MRCRIRFGLALLVIALLAGACGSGDASGSGGDTPSAAYLAGYRMGSEIASLPNGPLTDEGVDVTCSVGADSWVETYDGDDDDHADYYEACVKGSRLRYGEE